jgi:hypothetical protein
MMVGLARVVALALATNICPYVLFLYNCWRQNLLSLPFEIERLFGFHTSVTLLAKSQNFFEIGQFWVESLGQLRSPGQTRVVK